jgi:hypothetical protein
MVFGIFGRVRAVEPCIGKGIDEVNLRYLIGAINGPCTCTVQGGFGIDMLTNMDWNKALPESVYMAGAFDEDEDEETAAGPVDFGSPAPDPGLTAPGEAQLPTARPVPAGGKTWFLMLGLVGAAGVVVLGILVVGVVLVATRSRGQA